jgi:hypothetical protein
MAATRTTKSHIPLKNQSHILHSVLVAVSILAITVKARYGHEQTHLNITKDILLNHEWLWEYLYRESGLSVPSELGVGGQELHQILVCNFEVCERTLSKGSPFAYNVRT